MLDRILDKLGVKRPEDLKADELKAYRAWQAILQKPDVTIDDLKALLPKELARATAELRDYKNGPRKDSFYKAYTTLLELITSILTTPTTQREQLKAELQRRFDLQD